jgi:hypothetical protein
VVGMAAVAPETPHEGLWGDVRAGYVFRYYSRGAAGLPHEGLVAILVDAQTDLLAARRTLARAPGTRHAEIAPAAATAASALAQAEAARLNPARAVLAQDSFEALAATHPALRDAVAAVLRFDFFGALSRLNNC